MGRSGKMEMLAAKCSVCGGDVQMDASMQSGTCLYCGAKMVFEEAVKNAGKRERAQALLRMGWDALAIHNCKEALRYANQALEKGADWHEGYFLKGLVLAEEQLNGQKQDSGYFHYIRRALEMAHQETNEQKIVLGYLERFLQTAKAFRAKHETFFGSISAQDSWWIELCQKDLDLFCWMRDVLRTLEETPRRNALELEVCRNIIDICRIVLGDPLKGAAHGMAGRLLSQSQRNELIALCQEQFEVLKRLDYALARQMQQQPLLLEQARLQQAAAMEKKKLIKAELIVLGIFLVFLAATALAIGVKGLEAFLAGLIFLALPIFGGIALVRGRKISQVTRQLRQLEQALAKER